MIKCRICENHIIIDPDSSNRNRNIGVYIKETDDYMCIGCNEVNDFINTEIKPKKNVEKKEEKKLKLKNIQVGYICINCKNNYTGNKCDKCGTINPLLIRKPKKKKKKKK